MRHVKLSDEEVLLISKAVDCYIDRRLRLGVASIKELKKLTVESETAVHLLDKIAEVPNE